jgi:hypothetical protein
LGKIEKIRDERQLQIEIACFFDSEIPHLDPRPLLTPETSQIAERLGIPILPSLA